MTQVFHSPAIHPSREKCASPELTGYHTYLVKFIFTVGQELIKQQRSPCEDIWYASIIGSLFLRKMLILEPNRKIFDQQNQFFWCALAIITTILFQRELHGFM